MSLGSVEQVQHYKVGLTSQEAAEGLKKYGPNIAVSGKDITLFDEIKKALLDPMGLMLLVLGVLYLLIGDPSDAIILFVAFIPVTAVDVVLEIRAHRALRALKATLQKTSKVIRDGKVVELDSTHIVPGDVLVLDEGQTISADGRLLESHSLSITEAALTGESIPIVKLNDDTVYCGTTVLQGRGLALIEQTGRSTKYGQIARLVQETEGQKTPLQIQVNKVIKNVTWFAALLAVLLLIIEIVRGEAIYQSIIVALTFGMAAVPEEFPIVFTLYLSLGAWRLSRHGVLVKSLPSVESLGNVDVICTDKTGTLTEGRFQLEKLHAFDDEKFAWKAALMACETHIVDAMEAAIVEKADGYKPMLTGWQLKWDYPFEATGKHMTHVWQNSDGDCIVAMKGATEGVLEHCNVGESEKTKIIEETERLASQGRRILGLAARIGKASGNRDQDERDLKFLGLLAFSDPIRNQVSESIRLCQSAGIEVKMLTGDHPTTAHAVADEIDLKHSHEYLFSGRQLAEMPIEKRMEGYRNGAIFSRVTAEQKHEMVKYLKSTGLTVAMTGDGINDAPVLKLADIGISMGMNATDVARSSAQMILMKNDFNGIVHAVLEGRRIFANLRKSFSYLISFHAPLVLLAFLPPLLGWGELLLPIHIVLLEIIVHPVSAYAFENLSLKKSKKEKEIMTKSEFMGSLLIGLFLASACLYTFVSALPANGIDVARSYALSVMLVGNIGLMLFISWPGFTTRIYVMALGLALSTVGVSQSETLSEVFHLKPISLVEFSRLAIIGTAAVLLPTIFVRKTVFASRSS